MKIYLFLILCTFIHLEAFQFETKTTYINYKEKQTEASYFNQKESLKTVISIFDTYNLSENMRVYGKLSNRLENTLLDKLFVKYESRHRNNQFGFKFGTIETFKGVFDTTVNSRVQPPSIFPASSVYNDEWMSGTLDTIIGGKFSYGIISDSTIYEFNYSVGNIRVTDKLKSEQGVINHDSVYSDVEFKNKLTISEFLIKSTIGVEIFVNTAESKFKIKDVSGLSNTEKFKVIMSSKGEFDKSILAVSDKPYDFSIDRFGLLYINSKCVFGYEMFKMRVKHSENNTNTKSKGEYYYFNYSLFDDVTPYLVYGFSKDPRGDKVEETTLGLRYSYNKNWTLIGEVKSTKWIQTETLEDYNELKNGNDVTKLLALQVIYKF